MKPNLLFYSILFCIPFFIYPSSKLCAQRELVTFSITSNVSEPKVGDTITYKINTKNFRNVNAFQFGLKWDSSVFKVATNNSWINQYKNNIIPSGSFNILPNRFLVSFIATDIVYGDSLAVDDSTLLTFKLVLKTNGSGQNVCFSNATLPIEITYYDSVKEHEISSSNYIAECNKLVLFAPKVEISSYNNAIYTYDTVPYIKIKAIVNHGVKPYQYHWGSNFGTDVDSIIIPNPQIDTAYNLFVTDAKGDTAFMTYYVYNKITNYKLKLSTQPIYCNYFTPTIKLSVTVENGVPPYKFDWITKNTIHSDTNSIEIVNPNIDFNYNVLVTDANQNKGKINLAGYISKLKLTSNTLSEMEYRLDDDKMILSANTSPWFNAIKYKWDDGVETVESTRLIARPTKDQTFFKTIALDKDGHELKDSILQFFNNKPFLKLTSLDTLAFNNSVSFTFSSNPRNAQIEWRYEFSGENQMITKSGISGRYLDLSFNDISAYAGKVLFYYKLVGVDTSIVPEQSVQFMAKSSKYYLNFNNLQMDYYVCEANKKVTIKANAVSTMPNDVLFYDWGEFGKGYGLDSISVFLISTKAINFSVLGVLQTKISNTITVHVGEKDNFKIISVPKQICYDAVILIQNVKVLHYTLKHCSKNFETYSTYIANNKFTDNIPVYHSNRTPNDNEYLILRIDQTNSGLCLDSNYQPYVDTIQMNPSPKVSRALKCVTNNDTSFQFKLDDYLDPQNLNSFKLNSIKSYYHYTNGTNKSRLVKSGIESNKSELTFLKDTIGENKEKFYSTITLVIDSKYEENGCVSYQNVTVQKIEKPKMLMSPKYQSINTGEYIDTFFHKKDNIYNLNLGHLDATEFILDYAGTVSNSLLSYNPFSTYKAGQLFNSFSYPITAKFIIFGSYLGCKIDPDTAYVTVNPLNPIFQSDATFTESDEFSQGKIKITKDDLERPIDFEFYPNPVQQFINIQYLTENPSDTELSIYDRSGKVLQSGKISLQTGKNQFQVDTKDLIPGTYILHLRNKENLKTLQFVKN